MTHNPESRESEAPIEGALARTLQRSIGRRELLAGGAVAAAGARWAGGRRAASAADGQASPSSAGTSELPADAAPAKNQTYVTATDITIPKAVDFYETVYQRPAVADLFSEPLIRLDKNLALTPASAEKWAGSADGMTWTFTIREGLTWSDGARVTARDWIATFQYAADPKHAWDFTWYFQGVIKGWNDAIAGNITLDQLGVRTGADEHDLIIETEVPAPYLPAMLLYSNPLSAAALATHGPLYNVKPETAVSSGPFIIGEWLPDQRILYVKNDRYTGTLNVPVTKVDTELASPEAFFGMYQNNEIDYLENPAPAALTLMMSDPKTAKEVYSGVGDFPTWYVFFDVTRSPFTDLKVRQAWSHAIDRDTLKAKVLGPNGTPAYSWLAPGFPGSQREALKGIQNYDPATARRLLSEAGFPNGEGFPTLQMWLRAPSPLDKDVAGAIGAMLKQVLNINIELLDKDQQGFTAALDAKPTQILLGFVRYGMDYLDPSNMLSVWKSGGRHSWSNPEFDAKLKAASAFLGDPSERIKMFQEAERILVEDVPAVFIYHGTPVQFIKPWVKGAFLEPDKIGIRAMHWPGYATMSTVPQELYIGRDAPDRTSL